MGTRSNATISWLSPVRRLRDEADIILPIRLANSVEKDPKQASVGTLLLHEISHAADSISTLVSQN
jgi:hypothetical protein